MNPSLSHSEALCAQLAETCLLQCYLMEALDRHQLESCVRRRSEFQHLAGVALDTLHQHTTQLASVLAARPTDHPALNRSSARFGSRLIAFVSRNRPREVAAMLRDDYVLLRLAVAKYTKLCALAHRDPGIANLASSHLRALDTLRRNLAHQLRQATPQSAPPADQPPSATPWPLAAVVA